MTLSSPWYFDYYQPFQVPPASPTKLRDKQLPPAQAMVSPIIAADIFHVDMNLFLIWWQRLNGLGNENFFRAKHTFASFAPNRV
ncbi:hypothetical protein [Cupriavidus oxalaticus]|uniref:hypothetical protein n=1 Tax=Cupriavidus oxalaticus TaxID=96344 RepID=UPI003F73B823